MTKSEERNLFLKRLATIYAQNPDFPVTRDFIYDELFSFNVHNGKNEKIAPISLLNVQISLNEKYKNNNKVNSFTFGKGYFWAIENRNGLSDKEFYSKIGNAIKLYIAVDSEDINFVADALFEFMINEGIVTQSKISKEFRNDALVIRVATKEEAKKVIDFYNEKFAYDPRIKPNPFLFSKGKVGVAMDGILSYNSTLAKFLEYYFQEKKHSNTLDKVSEKDFCKFLSNELLELQNGYNGDKTAKYGLDSSKKVLNFMVIANLLIGNINDSLDLNNIFDYQKVGEDIKNYHDSARKIDLLYVMNGLNNKYGTSVMHKIINAYIESGDINLFTRENNIRGIMYYNFNPAILEKMLGEMSYSALIDASWETEKKYDSEQLGYALDKLLKEHKIDGFTNTNDVRSYLGFISNKRIMTNMLSERMEERGQEFNYENVLKMILEEIERRKNKEKGHAR